MKVAVVAACWDAVKVEAYRSHLAAFSTLARRVPAGNLCSYINTRMPTPVAVESGIVSALEWGADWVFYYDDDIILEPGTFVRLLDSADPIERPVVSALGFFRYPPFWPSIFCYDAIPLSKPLPAREYERDSMIRVDATGFCALVIHRDVFSKMFKPWFQTASPDGEFMARCRTLGIPVYCNTAIKVGHLGTMRIDEETRDSWIRIHGEEKSHSAAVHHFRVAGCEKYRSDEPVELERMTPQEWQKAAERELGHET